MSLSEIKNKLYKKDLEKDLVKHDDSEFDARLDSVQIRKPESIVEDAWEDKKTWLTPERKEMLRKGGIALGIVVGIALLLVAVYQIRKASFNEGRVVVSINGPKEARSGKLLTYEIAYDNNNWASLNGATLRITHPESFKPEESTIYKEESPTVSVVDLGKLAGHATGKISFSGKEYSPKGTLMYLKADLLYSPSNFNSQFDAQGQLGVNIISTPITLEIMAPQNLSNGDSLDYQISYKNVGEEDFEGIRVKVDYPAGFSFSKSNPEMSESNNVWYIGHLSAGAEGKIIISGKLVGDRDQIKSVKAYVGTISQGEFLSYNEEVTDTKIVSSPLAILQTVNGLTDLNVNAGDTLQFEINYINNSDLGLRDVIVTENLDSPALDYATLGVEGGAYNGDTKTITWKSSDYPTLANLGPGQGGSIRFSIKVKGVLPVDNANSKNFVISSVAKVDSPDIPTPLQMNKIIAGNKIDIKVNSKIALDVKGFYTDSAIPNSGPIPPKVGQTTTYTMHLKAVNVSNDISGGRVDVVLPTGVTFTGNIYPLGANLTYNERANTMTWDIGTMRAGEGITSPAREVAFQIKINPSMNQAGSTMDLLSSANFSATDLFTGENLTAQSEKKTIMLLEDSTVGTNGGKIE